MENHVQDLIKKAAEAGSADEAMKLAQAACNAANAMCALATSKTISPERS